MKLKFIALLAASALLGTEVYAQGVAAGRVVRMADFSISDMMQFSQYNYSFGTARSASMGGAFGSLGADISTIGINPAGLGMYRGSEFSMSPSLTWTKSSSSFDGRYTTPGDDKYTRFAIGNIGIALNTYQSGSRALTSFTLGFSYNKLADYNYNSNIGLDNQTNSILDVFTEQVRGIPSASLSNKANPSPWRNNSIYPNQWGAALAYQCFAINEVNTTNHYYYPNLANDALNNNYLQSNTRGSLGEYNIAAGMNFKNKFYVGLTLGVQDLYYNEDLYYSELYTKYTDPSLAKTLSYFDYGQYRRFSGVGVNFKVGVIYRPIEALRIGLAVHTPTWMSMDGEYGAFNMYTQYQDGTTPLSNGIGIDLGYTDVYPYHLNYSSPARIIGGASYQLGRYGIISADYERVWYTGMRLGSSSDQQSRDSYKAGIKYSFKGQDNLRLGIEIKPTAAISLRAGYSYSGSGLSGKAGSIPTADMPVSQIDNPLAWRVNSFSVGAGYRTGGFSIDAAYVYSKTDYTRYSMFWYNDDSASVGYGSMPVSSDMSRNIVNLTLGFRF